MLWKTEKKEEKKKTKNRRNLLMIFERNNGFSFAFTPQSQSVSVLWNPKPSEQYAVKSVGERKNFFFFSKIGRAHV